LGIAATIVSLIISFGGAVHKLSNKRTNTPLWKQYDTVVLFSGENGTKVIKPAQDFNIRKGHSMLTDPGHLTILLDFDETCQD